MPTEPEPEVLPARKTSPEPVNFPGEKLKPTPTIAFTDAHCAAVERLRSDLKDAIRSLVAEQRQSDALSVQQSPEARIALRDLDQRLVDRKAQTQKLAVQIAEAEQTIAANQTLADEYAARCAEVAPWLDALLAALPSDADLAHAAAETRWLDSRAAQLLHETGDRRFRRPQRDPLHELRDRVEALMKAMERRRLSGLRRVRPVESEVRGETAS